MLKHSIKRIGMEEFDFDIRQNNEEKSTLNYPLIIGLIIALLLIGGGIYWFTTRDSDDIDDTQEETVSDGETTTTDANEPAAEKVIDSTDFNQNTEDTTASQDTQVIDNKNDTNATSTESATSTTSSESSSYDNSENIYFIVSGAFKNETNAQNKVGKLKAEGYDAVIVGQNGAGLFIVAYEGLSNIDDAKTKLAEVRQSHPQAWIYKKQN